MCKQNPHIVYTCINRGCWQINSAIGSTPFPITDEWSSICSLWLNFIIDIAQSYLQCQTCMLCRSTAVINAAYWYDITPFPTFVGQVLKWRTKSIYCQPPQNKKLTIFIQYEQPSSKCDKEKLGHVCLILYILAIDPGPCHLGGGGVSPPPKKSKKGGPACEEAALERGTC
jgi:hypothetical protein